MASEFDEYEESEAAEDTAWKPEHDFTTLLLFILAYRRIF